MKKNLIKSVRKTKNGLILKLNQQNVIKALSTDNNCFGDCCDCCGCTCGSFVLGSFVTNANVPSQRCWDFTPYHGPVVPSCREGTWLVAETGPGDYYCNGYFSGNISEYGELIGLPNQYCSRFGYAGYMKLMVKCPGEDWPGGCNGYYY